jgi:hypothetical protein
MPLRRKSRSTGQCSSGNLAFSRVGQPHPSTAGSRSTTCKNGFPQYDTPRRTTRIGQISQIAARCAQSTAVAPIPIRRIRADAALAIAREIERNELVWQVKQAMSLLSDECGRSRQELIH